MSTAYKDYYKILGLARTATAKEVKAAYRKLARKHHPDLNQGDAAAEARFKEVNEANEVLSDPKKRQQYDDYGFQPQHAGRDSQARYARGTTSQGGFSDLFGADAPFSDFFYSMFGSPGVTQTRGSASARGGDVEGEALVSLDEAFTGAKRTVELTGGGGAGRRVEVAIPAGIADGARVRAAGQGSMGMGGGGAGDLFIRVRVAPHPRFQRIGNDLKTRVPVPLRTALLGGMVKLPVLASRSIELAVPAGTQNGSTLRLRGQGMPIMRGGGRGDLLAEVDVRLPQSLDPAARALAEALAEDV
ncbi:MAG: DnaJ C-terminal domain-containing protein [Candidatus Dormibacteria bacterium]